MPATIHAIYSAKLVNRKSKHSAQKRHVAPMPLAAGFNTCSEINSFLSWQRYELTSVTEYFKTLIKLNAHIFNKKSPIYPAKHLNFQLFTASILSKCYPA